MRLRPETGVRLAGVFPAAGSKGVPDRHVPAPGSVLDLEGALAALG